MKKGGIIFAFISILLMLSAIGFVSAAQNLGTTIGENVANFVTGIASALDPILRYTLGDTGLDADVFIVKVLLFVLMLAIFYFAVGKVPMFRENIWLQWIIAIVAAILGARFLSPAALINFVWLPTGIVGVVLTSLLPFIIFFFFIESFKTQKLIRRVGWILFGVLYLGLAATRWSDFESTTGGTEFNLGWLYVITAILALLCFLFDRWVQKKKEENEKKKAARTKVQFHEHKLAGQLAELEKDLINATTDAERERIKGLIKVVKEQAKEAAKLLGE